MEIGTNSLVIGVVLALLVQADAHAQLAVGPKEIVGDTFEFVIAGPDHATSKDELESQFHKALSTSENIGVVSEEILNQPELSYVVAASGKTSADFTLAFDFEKAGYTIVSVAVSDRLTMSSNPQQTTKAEVQTSADGLKWDTQRTVESGRPIADSRETYELQLPGSEKFFYRVSFTSEDKPFDGYQNQWGRSDSPTLFTFHLKPKR